MIVKLLSSIQLIEWSSLGLQLPLPDGLNNGGYLTPFGFSYSPVDALVCGLGAKALKVTVTNLALFYQKSGPLASEQEVKLLISLDDEVSYTSIYELKLIGSANSSIDAVMAKNAPIVWRKKWNSR